MRKLIVDFEMDKKGNEKKEQISQMLEDFFSSSKIPRNMDTEGMLKYLLQPQSVNRMIIASDFGLPVLTFVVNDLEKMYGNCANAPLNHNGQYQNAVHRQNIGRMTKYIMREFGYEPIDGKLSERARLPKFSGTKYFSTSAVYAKSSKYTNE